MDPLRIRYQTIAFGPMDIHVRTLWDCCQFQDPGGKARRLGISSAAWPMFGVIWDSGRVLARLMLDYEIQGKSFLEIGCGIGLASLVLGRRGATVTATDHHPEAGTFLTENIRINQTRPIPFVRTGWADETEGLGRYDVIIGSDLLYEPDHDRLLSAFIQRHSHPACEVIIVDPGRGNQNRFTREMETLGFAHSRRQPESGRDLEAPFKGLVLTYQR